MRKPWMAAAGLGAVLALAFVVVQISQRRLASHERDVLARQAQLSLGQVALGQLALQRVAPGETQDFARRLIDAHGRALQAIRSLAREEGLFVPHTPDQEHQVLIERLRGLEGPPFERAFLDAVGREHLKAIMALQRAIDRGHESRLRSLAAEWRPLWQEHLALARGISARAGYMTGR